MSFLFFFLVIIAALFEAFGDVVLKKWALLSSTKIFILGLFLYGIAVVFWAYALKYKELSKAIVIATIVNVFVVMLFGIFYFKETLTLPNKIGILFGCCAIVLLEI